MSATVLINGRLCTGDSARVSVLDRGFLYGDAVFEVLRTWHGEPCAMGEHLGRLFRSAMRVGISMSCQLGFWEAETREALVASGEGERVIRLMVTRGEGAGIDPPRVGAPTRVMIVEPLIAPRREVYENGVRVITLPAGFGNGHGTVLGAKTTNYLWNILATREARRRGAHEALFTSGASVVLEGASSNVFAYVDGRLVTPSLCDAILPGITREIVIAAACSLGVKCEEIMVTESDLFRADEVFLTSSVREVVPVVGVSDHEIGDGRPGACTRALHRRLRDMVGARAPMPWE